MSDQVEQYLQALKAELHGCDYATIQDALADAEEHLRTALANVIEQQPDSSEEDALAAIIDDFGSPEEAAGAYREIEAYLKPALTLPGKPQIKSGLMAFFSVIIDPSAWGALLYFSIMFLTGTVYFSWLIFGLPLALGTIVLIVGFPLLYIFLLSIRRIAFFEGRIIETLLGLQMPRKSVFFDHGLGFWAKLKALILDRRTWFGLLFIFLQFPLGMVYFVVFLTAFAISVTFLLAPIIRLAAILLDFYASATQTGIITTVILPAAPIFVPLLSLLGLLMLAITMHVAKFVGRLHGVFLKSILVKKQ